MLLANYAQLSPESIRHTLLFIHLLHHQTYSITNTSIAVSYVTGNKNSQGIYSRKSAPNIFTNKYISFLVSHWKQNPQGGSCREQEIPSIGIILILYQTTAYFNGFNTVIFVSNILYILSKD
jgi:hypothetical protein